MIDQYVTILAPIKIKPSEHYLLVFEDAKGFTYFFHKEHTAIIDDKKVKFKEGQYDGWSVKCGKLKKQTKKHASL